MKVFLPSRALLILSILCLLQLSVFGFFQNSISKAKTKYEFTDTRISAADSLLKNRKYQEALEAYQIAYDIFESESFYEGMVYTKERMGRAHRSLGKDSLSKAAYDAAARLSRERLGPNHILESKAYLNNGIRAHYSEKSVEASRLLDSAKHHYDKADTYDSSLYRDMVNFKYYTYYYSNLSRDTLIKYLNERGRIYDKEGASVEESVFFLTDYCRAYFKIGDFQKSVAYGIEAVKTSEASLELIDSYFYTDALFNLSRSLWSQKQHYQALDVVDKLLLYGREKGIAPKDLFGYYNLKALILSDIGEYENAAKEFHRILKLLETSGSSDENFRKETVRDAIMNLGVCYQLMGKHEEAKKYLDRALDQEKKVNSIFDTPFSSRYKFLGQFYGDLNDRANALFYYDSALRNSILTYRQGLLKYPNDSGFSATYENLSLLKNKQISMERLAEAEFPDSLELLTASIEYAERTHEFLVANRDELQVSGGRLFLSENFKTLYESAINSIYLLDSLVKDDSYLNLAPKFFALSKSILFLEQSGELGEVQDSRLSSDNKNLYYQIKTDIDSLESRFYQLIEHVNTSDSLRVINEELLRLDTKLSLFRDSLRVEFGLDMTYGSFELNDLREVEDYVNENGENLIVDFFLGDRYTFILGYGDNKKVLKRIELDSSFYSQYKALMEIVNSRPEINGYDAALQRYQESAFYLFSKLLHPLLNSFDKTFSKITIIPDGFLANIPFEALISTKNDSIKSYAEIDYLLSSYSINYALSAKSLRAKMGTDLPRKAPKFLFGIGYNASTKNSSEPQLARLSGTEKEIAFLRREVGGDYLLGSESTKDGFMKYARNYDVLHLAVHGQSDLNNRYGSKLIFSNDEVLKTADLYVADLQARLVVLSACESGVGEISKGEGVFSIARGFALVGVPSIVMSLWNVNDNVSSKLMASFYNNLKNGDPVNQALTRSKRSYLLGADKFTSHPYYWSAFVSLGNDLEVKSAEHKYEYLLIIIGVVIIAFLLYKSKKEKEP